MRTYEEILKRIEHKKEYDILGLTADLIGYLPYKHAKKYLKPEVTEEDWKDNVKELTEENVLKEMKEYMPFARDKAIGNRGLSASRSVEHYCNWLFLLGDDEMLEFASDDDNYAQYGWPILKAISEKYGFEIEDMEQVVVY